MGEVHVCVCGKVYSMRYVSAMSVKSVSYHLLEFLVG